MESRDRYPVVCIDRRHILSMLFVPFLAACAGGLGTKPQDPIAKAAPFIKKDIAWKIGDFLDFLAALPPSGLLALKKTLELLPDSATESALKGTQVDVMEINTTLCQKSSWFGVCRNPSDFDYHGMVMTVADQAKIDSAKLKKSSTFDVEQLFMEKVYAEVEKDFISKWEKMSIEDRKKVLDRADPNGKLKDHAMMASAAGSIVIRALSLVVAFNGFSAYVAATTALGAATAAVGTTLPFAAYTSLTTVISVLTGPVGWAIRTTAGVSSLILAGRPDSKRMTSFTLTMHALKLDALRAAGG